MSDASHPTITRQGDYLTMPGLATAHSHAFQRALRGRTQRRDSAAPSFWSWRGLMYDLVTRLDPDAIFQLSRFAFVELALSGVTAVGEFHYVHHDPQGQPYANRTELAEAVIRAARATGIRISLIRTAYLRAGYQQSLVAGQRRFVDDDIDKVLADVEQLQARFAADPLVEIGLAAHSIRAVPLPQVIELAEYAREHDLPFHMHVAEQRQELAECEAEYGHTPVALLADQGVLDGGFVGIHATHLTAAEISALGQAGAMVCLCRTTERDLGDGLPQTAALIQAGAQLCVGVDSHAGSDAFEELRAIELDERSRTEARQVAADGRELLRIGTALGYEAIGMGAAWPEDLIRLRADDPSLAGATDDLLADVVLFGATPRAIDTVTVAGQPVVQQGRHPAYREALAGYLAALERCRG